MSHTDSSFSHDGYFEYLNNHSDPFQDKLVEVIPQNLPKKIWSKDYKLWQDNPDEVSNRLGWLELADSMEDEIQSINSFSREIIDEGFRNLLLIGMGGSSLAPEFFEKTFSGELSITVIDTTDPETISVIRNSIEPENTLIIVSTKSGTTVETLSLMNYFYYEFCKLLGEELAGSHFAAITDPGSTLEKTAEKLNFRKIFVNDPNVGGRFSALSHFGLVPASLAGVDIKKLLRTARNCTGISKLDDVDKNLPLRFGTLIGYFAEHNIDKLTIVTSEKIKNFAYWIEQLVAESTGKKGAGVLPVIEEKFSDENRYGKDRLLVFIKLKDDIEVGNQLKSAVRDNIPVVCIELNDLYDIGAQFFFWEFATSVCGIHLHINPFDQPDVESSKKYTKKFVEDYKRKGFLSELKPLFEYGGMDFLCSFEMNDIDSFRKWLRDIATQGSYIAIQAFISPDEKNEKLLRNLADNLSSKFKIPATFGFGPRFLHSTGQLHKGDGGNGVFIQFISNIVSDLPIPDDPLSDKSSVSFGVLLNAQALGDYLALTEKKRSIARINLGSEVEENLTKFTGLL